ncbi:hypothetical protein LOC71_09270 [Rhodopirellula sp. JC740]|uniref:Uncharacterized protein n=1 Tax=Rhodopirellula halodulae TaxID=2894198 RepID=A0ABS8NI40_9BACT|nr:hypothetical protein [Rhodopirellula sp. JC740]MCC9642463.1 hypothetical protein [Rhodopirellula sp. JC740]
MLMIGRKFAGKVEQMLEDHFQHSQLASATESTERSLLSQSLPFRFLVRACRLLAPLQQQHAGPVAN